MGAVVAMAVDPCGAWLASARRDGVINICDPHDGSARFWLVGRQHKVSEEVTTLMVPAPDGRWLACSGGSPKIRIWSPMTGERLNTLSAAGGGVRAVVIEPTGTWLASASTDGAIRLWEPDASIPYRVLRGHLGAVNALAVAPTGTWLASCGEDASVRVWNLEDGSETVLTVPSPDRRLTISPNETWLASAGGDPEIRIWDPRTGGQRCVLTGHNVPPAALTSDSTGRYLCSVAEDATIRVWEPASGNAVASSRVDGPLDSVRWSGEHLIAGGARGVYQFQLHQP